MTNHNTSELRHPNEPERLITLPTHFAYQVAQEKAVIATARESLKAQALALLTLRTTPAAGLLWAALAAHWGGQEIQGSTVTPRMRGDLPSSANWLLQLLFKESPSMVALELVGADVQLVVDTLMAPPTSMVQAIDNALCAHRGDSDGQTG
jgi:hypothetical protein